MSQEHGNLNYSLGLRLATMEDLTTRPHAREEYQKAQEICRTLRNYCAKLVDEHGEDILGEGGQKSQAPCRQA